MTLSTKAWLKSGLALGLLGGVLAGCSGGEKQARQEGERGSITSTIYDRGSVPSGMGMIEDNMWSKWINENGPVDVKFTAVPRWESQSKLNVLFASGSAPDVIFEFGTSIRNTLFNQKQLLPLDDLIASSSTEYKALMEKYPQLKQAGTKSDGKLYEVGRMNEVYPLTSFFIREDWLEKLNLEVPTTEEEMIAVAKAFAEQDPDGNGVDDTYGIGGLQFGDTSGIFRYMFNANWVNEEDGEIVVGPNHMKEVTAFKRALFESGAADKDFLTDKDGAKSKQAFLNGKTGMFGAMTSDYTAFAANELDTLMKNVPEAKLKVIALPSTSVGQYTTVWNNPVQMTAVVNARTKNPEAVMQYIDFLTKTETGRTFKNGFEGTHYKVDENGSLRITDAEKYKQEVSWAGDYALLYSRLEEGKAGYTEMLFDEDIPAQKEALRLFKEARDVYMTDLPVGEGVTHSEHMPQLPKDLQTKMTNVTTAINDTYTRSIIGGSKFTVDQAAAEAEQQWQQGGGPEIEAWYKDWWSQEKDNVLVWDDFYEIYRQQQADFAKEK
ncbi:extracellular solute-binding protein [Saccharibacillus sp. CPCC 101409]|uniref:extracellular solute-binding protein n=1 Tax=Saccharibacillus sp. CPCC 101409 TaxID=3058041 RepID=UPI002672617F|nr:extracellular solute-binding protein [Saccharibacillus sp. CPCC 101409]MDO3412466.1 extracellular solute-binding protein [Saccharibacillus sp. CPCC 101409]